MSEQQAQGADEAIDLNNELKTRREKLAALREQGVAFRMIFAVTTLLTSSMRNLMVRKTTSSPL
ncbi:lysyl-tRNA synthetase [Klebsiella michiganensis]|uniref:Lysyl-tRNA synthetase n=1 Tax=Klebsiella michiganensis TaxID=1134687 RepID=A0A7H4LY66_9ENTR|nr:lysyl-tRNA synthetase [Klebsiella michiganensis]